MIGGLLRHVSPPQRFSHSGIITTNFREVRHSTASEQRYKDHYITHLPPSSGTGFDPNFLKFGWPGTITETVDDAYEGRDRFDPDDHRYFLQSFNKDPAYCPQDTASIFPTIVKPPPQYDAAMRPQLEKIADEVKNIHGHYRFFVYSQARVITDPAFIPPPAVAWAYSDAPQPVVCSSTVWYGTKRAQVQVKDFITADPDDRPQPSDPNLRGLFIYSEDERRAAAEWFYTQVYNGAYEESGWLGRLLTDAPDNTANQMVNCFAFDWCGDELGSASQDSDRWKNPGTGIAVSPDDILNWDAPPRGVYGYNEFIAYVPRAFNPVWRWEDKTFGCQKLANDIQELESEISELRDLLKTAPDKSKINSDIDKLQQQLSIKRSVGGCNGGAPSVPTTSPDAPTPTPGACPATEPENGSPCDSRVNRQSCFYRLIECPCERRTLHAQIRAVCRGKSVGTP